MEKEESKLNAQQQQLDMPVVSGSCFWKHKWMRWEQYTQPMIARSNGQRCIEYRQRRICIRCGKMQDELVSW